ncbi:MAG TPA: metallophosphoesterase [bacterium]|nr:metallophosphoesterase [bacterium]HQL63424.1 metallophosphoesterase [bacterium]
MREARTHLCVVLTILLSSAISGFSQPVLGPYLQNIKSDGVTIMWETLSPSVGKVVYGEDELSMAAAETQPRIIHEVTLTDLKPGSAYRYRCSWEDQLSPSAQFQTAPAEGTRQCRIVLYGDSRTNRDVHKRIATLIARESPDLVLHAGDLVTSGMVREQWKREFFDPISPFAASTTWFTVPGNHEQESENYYNYVSLPGNEMWWSTDYANVHIIGLDSCLPGGEDSEQYKWLVQDIQKNRQEWTIVLFHHPLFNVHPTRPMPDFKWTWQSLFQEYGVDLAVSGHDHHYHRTYPIGAVLREPQRGVMHITTGGGGAPLYPVVGRPYSAFQRSCHHFVVLDVGGDRIVGRVIDIEGKGIDSFILDKQSLVSPEEYVSYESLVLDRDLRQAADEIFPVLVGRRGRETEVHLQTKTQFQVPIVVVGRWLGGNLWKINPAEFRLPLEPGQDLDLRCTAQAERENVYPLPTLDLVVNVAPTVKNVGFRNRSLWVHPLKVALEEELKPKRIRHAPVIDARLDEKDWSKAPMVDRFLVDEGTAFQEKKSQVLFMTNEEKLFIGAHVEQDPARLQDLEETSPDYERMDRVENIAVYIWNGLRFYQFFVAATGDILDMRGSDLTWNSDAIAMTSINETGWTVEVAIPLAGMIQEAPPRTDWRINVTRMDGVTGQRGEWIPIFSGTGLDPSQFARLDL